jgi:hypothetical protein
VKTKSICNAKASVELATAHNLMLIQNYDLDIALEEEAVELVQIFVK